MNKRHGEHQSLSLIPEGCLIYPGYNFHQAVSAFLTFFLTPSAFLTAYAFHEVDHVDFLNQ